MLEVSLLTVLGAFIMGAILGSFANVIIVRLPADESIAWPASHCRHCKTPIRWFDNIPIFGYLWLRGRCRACGQQFSWRYPLVESIMGLVWASLFAVLGPTWFTAEVLIFAFALVTASFIDFDHMILPDKITLSGLALALIGAAINPERSFVDAALGVLFGGGFLYLVAWLYAVVRKQEGMGGGDIKLLAWMGALLGWQAIPFIIICSSLVGSAVGMILAVRSRQGLQQAIPFGPYLALAALIYLWVDGQRWMDWYFHHVF